MSRDRSLFSVANYGLFVCQIHSLYYNSLLIKYEDSTSLEYENNTNEFASKKLFELVRKVPQGSASSSVMQIKEQIKHKMISSKIEMDNVLRHIMI